MKRRLFAAVSAGVLVVSLSACGGKDDPGPAGSASATATSTASTSAAPTTAASDGEKVTAAILQSVDVNGSKLQVTGVESLSSILAQGSAAFKDLKVEPEECKRFIVGEMAALDEKDIANADMALGVEDTNAVTVVLSKGADFQIRAFEKYNDSVSKCSTMTMDMGGQKMEVGSKEETAPAVEGWDEVHASAVVVQGQETGKSLTARKGDYVLTVSLIGMPGSAAPSMDVAVNVANEVAKKLK